MSFTKECQHCKKKFVSRKSATKYCCHSCYLKRPRERKYLVETVCKKCKKIFITSRNDLARGCSIYCSRQCYWESMVKHKYVCRNCGLKISGKGVKRTYCSRKCFHEFVHRKNNGRCYKIRYDKSGYLVKGKGFGGKGHLFIHRLIVTQALGREVGRNEIVHHINGDKTDNRHCNLLVCSHSYHRWLHDQMSKLYMREHFKKRRKKCQKQKEKLVTKQEHIQFTGQAREILSQVLQQ